QGSDDRHQNQRAVSRLPTRDRILPKGNPPAGRPHPGNDGGIRAAGEERKGGGGSTEGREGASGSREGAGSRAHGSGSEGGGRVTGRAGRHRQADYGGDVPAV